MTLQDRLQFNADQALPCEHSMSRGFAEEQLLLFHMPKKLSKVGVVCSWTGMLLHQVNRKFLTRIQAQLAKLANSEAILYTHSHTVKAVV